MNHRHSYWKATAAALAAALVCSAAIVLSLSQTGFAAAAEADLLTLAMLVWILVGSGGLVCLWRDSRIDRGGPDPVTSALTRVRHAGLLSRLGLRDLLGGALRPGDFVEVRSLAEIRTTLDVDSALDGLPFMAEMEAFCGRHFRVHRRVDKINDMRNKTGLRRMRSAVTLTAVRCNGGSHSGCQAGCQIVWKDAWLKRLTGDVAEVSAASVYVASSARDDAPRDTYVCQMTRLWEASQAMSRLDIRQDLRPLVFGNVGAVVWVLVLLTRLFNVFQGLRGGAVFPSMPAPLVNQPPLAAPAMLVEGQRVVVERREVISATLVNSRTKGLWFDRDMVRFCGADGVVQKRVDRLIHEATGKVITMKTAGVILQDVTATGEFLRLCPQHEHIFWREAWLRTVNDSQAGSLASQERPRT